MPPLHVKEIFKSVPSVAVPVLFFGFYPEPLLNTISASIDNLINNYEMNLKFHLALKEN